MVHQKTELFIECTPPLQMMQARMLFTGQSISMQVNNVLSGSSVMLHI